MKPLMQMLDDGYELHVRQVNLTEYRTLVKGDERLTGVKQSQKAKLMRAAIIEKKREFKGEDGHKVEVYGLSVWGQVLADEAKKRAK